MALILVRHTQPDIAPGICYGQTDLDVAASFEQDARRAYTALPRFDRIISSPLRRCRKLAEHISEMDGSAVTNDPRLMEMDFGTWECKAWPDIPRAEIDAWAADFFHARPHGGESVAILTARTKAAINEWRQQDGTTLMVTHAGVIRAARAEGETSEAFNFKLEFGEHIFLT